MSPSGITPRTKHAKGRKGLGVALSLGQIIVRSAADVLGRLPASVVPVVLAVGLTPAAEASESGEFSYATMHGSVSISRYNGPGGNVVIPDTIEGLPVTDVGPSAFEGCGSLVGITFPDSVTCIRKAAFRWCTGLASLTLPGGLISIDTNAFDSCTRLASITLNPGIMSIRSRAFSSCTSLASITIPDSVTSIGDGAFASCTNLASITVDPANTSYSSVAGVLLSEAGRTLVRFPVGRAGGYVVPDDVENIGVCAFSGAIGLTTVTMPPTVTTIEESAFERCSSLTGLTIPPGVTRIGPYAFNGCTGLVSVTLPDGLTDIEQCVFYGCSGLADVTFPFSGSFASIGSSAFSGCASLAALTLPDGVTDIGSHAFSGCTSLTSLTLPNSLTSIGSYALSRCTSISTTVLPANVTSIARGLFSGCSSLVSVVIPIGVTSIGDSAFDDCSGLVNVTIPVGVTSIGDSAFDDCRGLVSVTIPVGVTSIGNSAFNDCDGLASVTIPVGVTSIGDSAFNDCDGLVSVTISAGVTSIGDRAFRACPDLTSIVVDDASASYASVDGVLFNRSLTTVLQYPGGRTEDYTIPEGVTSIGGSAFAYCTGLGSVTIPGSLISIAGSAFYGCKSLAHVTIPAGVTTIGASAFSGCTSLMAISVDADNMSFCSVDGVLLNESQDTLIAYPPGRIGDYVVPGPVSSIGARAFYGCNNLTSVVLTNGVTDLGARAFCDCINLTSVTLADSVTSIGDFAFLHCTALASIVIPRSVTSIGNSAFHFCTNLTDVTLSDGTTSIGTYAFAICTALTSVTIPRSVTTIGMGPFAGCSSLTTIRVDEGNASYCSVDGVLFNNQQDVLTQCPAGRTGSYAVPNGVRAIAAGAFGSCGGLTSVMLPDSVTGIGGFTFSYCDSLAGVYFQGNAPGVGMPGVMFVGENLDTTVYYLPDTAGWGPTFSDRPTAVWVPVAVTIDQATAQEDPTDAAPIAFAVLFDAPVSELAPGDIVLSGTAGANIATVTEIAPNDGTVYRVMASGMARSGTVVATIQGATVRDTAGNPNTASTSTDNTVTYDAPEVVTPPVFDPPSGTLVPDAGLDVALSGPAGATIWYTTDGSEPTVGEGTSTEYTGPLAIRDTTTLRARAFLGGLPPSAPAEASYLLAASNVLLAISLTGASVNSLEFGIGTYAGKGADPGIDHLMPPAPVETSEAAFLIPADGDTGNQRLQRDIRGGFDREEWQIEANAEFGEEVGLSWDPATLPADRELWLWRVDGRDGPAIPGTAAAMSDRTWVNVPGGEIHHYTIGTLMSCNIELAAGWNLIAPPMMPLDPDVTAVFAEENITPTSGARDNIYVDRAWGWNADLGRYEDVQAMGPKTGYWLHVDAPGVLQMYGHPCQSSAIELAPKWNLVGVAETTAIPDNTSLYLPAWWWIGAAQTYGTLRAGDAVSRGPGFWIYALEATTLATEQ